MTPKTREIIMYELRKLVRSHCDLTGTAPQLHAMLAEGMTPAEVRLLPAPEAMGRVLLVDLKEDLADAGMVAREGWFNFRLQIRVQTQADAEDLIGAGDDLDFVEDRAPVGSVPYRPLTGTSIVARLVTCSRFDEPTFGIELGEARSSDPNGAPLRGGPGLLLPAATWADLLPIIAAALDELQLSPGVGLPPVLPGENPERPAPARGKVVSA